MILPRILKSPRRFRPLRFEQFELRSLLAGEFGGSFAFGSDNNVSSTVGKKVAADAAGNTYLAGVFSGTVDFDDGPGNAILTSGGSLDGFIAKYAANGDLLWVKNWGGPDNDIVDGLAVDGAGNILIAGEFHRTADFDPGPGRFERTSQGLADVFVLKLDAAGNFVFANTWGNAGIDNVEAIQVDAAGNIFVLSDFAGKVDFDPGPGIANFTSSSGAHEVVLSRFDASGLLTQVAVIRGNSSAFAGSLAVGAAGDVAFSGGFLGTVDLDPGEGVVQHTTADYAYRTFIVRLNAQGNFVYGVATVEANAPLYSGIALDADGAVYVAGRFQGQFDVDLGPGTSLRTAVGSTDAVVLKLNGTGGLVFAVTFGGVGETFAQGLAITPTGQILVTGRFQNNVDFDPGPGTSILSSPLWDYNSIFLARLTPSGALVQAVAMETRSYVDELSLATDAAGNAIISGKFYGEMDLNPLAAQNLRTSIGYEDAFVVKVNTTGGGMFAHTFGSPYSGLDQGDALAVDAAGNLYVAGLFSNTVDFDLGPGEYKLTATGSPNSEPDVFIAKYGPNRELIWARAFGGSEQEAVYGLTVDPNGNVYLAGLIYGAADLDPGPGQFLRGSGVAHHNVLVKLDSAGNFVNAVTINGAGSAEVTSDNSGNIYWTSSFHGTVDFDPGASSLTRTGTSNATPFLVKYSPALVPAFAITWGGADEARTDGLALDPVGNIYVTGNFRGTADFDPGPGQVLRTSAGETDGFVSKFSPTGNLVYSSVFAGTGWTTNEDLAVDAAGGVYIVGEVSGTADFDPGAGTALRTAVGFRDQFVAKLDAAGQFAWAHVLRTSGAPATIALDSSGFIYFTGTNSGSTDFDPGAGVQTRTSGPFVARWHTNGDFDYVQLFDHSGLSFGFAAGGATIGDSTLDAAGNLWLTGGFSGEFDFDPGPSRNTEFISGVNVSDAFVVRLVHQTTGTLSAEFDSFGNLIIADQFTKNNPFTIEVTAGNVSITDAVEQFYLVPSVGTLSNNNRTLTVPLNHISGSLIVDGLDGVDTFLLGNLGELRSLQLNGGAESDNFGSADQRIAPNSQTAVRIDGGAGTDQMFMDIAPLAATTPVIMTDSGTLTAAGMAKFTVLSVNLQNVLTTNGLVNTVAGTILVQGTPHNDVALVTRPNPSNFLSEYVVRVNQLRVAAASAHRVLFFGDRGNDLAYVDATPIVAELNGNDGDDFLVGSISDDLLYGGGGNDRLLGRDGNDYLHAGNGDWNYVVGDAGDDRLHGGTGNDALHGGDGNDALDGQAGNDELTGGNGHDLLIGGVDADTLQGNSGNDLLVGAATDDPGSTTAYDNYDWLLLSILDNWITLQPGGFLNLYVTTDEAAIDTLLGGTGDDDFYTGTGDLLPDLNGAELGTDRQYQ